MKSLKISLAVCALALACAPAIAQSGGSDSQAFIEAVQKRDAGKALELIASHPTIIDVRDGDGDTGLIIALRAGEQDWTGFFLKKGADPNLAGGNSDTPLITAAKANFDEAAEWLIALGAKVDGANRSGETPLIIAVQRRDERLVRLLLNHGADPDHTDSVAGYSARDYAGRDPRARAILKLIDEKKPKRAPTSAN